MITAGKLRDIFWLEEGKLGGMCQPTNREVEILEADFNVGLLICLREVEVCCFGTEEPQEMEKGRLIHIPIPDYGCPNFEQVETFLEEAEKTIAIGKAVVVHCMGGRGRTGLMLACYLIKNQSLAVKDAIEVIRRHRPGAIEMENQLEFLDQYYEYVQGSK